MNILADTCFWISLCDPTDHDHAETVIMMDKILRDKSYAILVPYPVLYETLRDMVKKPKQVLLLAHYFRWVVKVPDAEYIEEAYSAVERQASMGKGTASMVDIAIMLMANDAKNNVRAILTRNGRDFAAFCQKYNLPMIENLEILNAI